MNATRFIFLMACALALQGCAVYSNPYEPTGRIQYRGASAYDEYAHDEGEPIVDLSIRDVSYYPWWSIDYYYLGSHYYRPGYFGSPYLSLGFNYGVPPYYWPYYGFYSPFYYPYASYAWYDPWYGWPRYGIGTDLFWTNVFWASRYQEHVRQQHDWPQHGEHGAGRYQYASSQSDTLSDDRDRAYASERLQQRGAAPVSRDVSIAPIVVAPPPAKPMPAMSSPTIVRQTRAPQMRASPAPGAPSPVASQPQMIRQLQAPPARPALMPRSLAPTPVTPSPADSGAPSYQKGPDRRHN